MGDRADRGDPGSLVSITSGISDEVRSPTGRGAGSRSRVSITTLAHGRGGGGGGLGPRGRDSITLRGFALQAESVGAARTDAFSDIDDDVELVNEESLRS